MTRKRLWAGTKLMIVAVSVLAGTFVSSAQEMTPEQEKNLRNAHDKEEILWLARILQSESNRRQDQILIACVVRNRVESGIWGESYQEVALAPKQFSGLNAGDVRYAYNISRNYDSTGAPWETALKIATAIYYAEDPLCPIPDTTMHFYSPHIIAAPAWAKTDKIVHRSFDDKGRNVFAFVDQVYKTKK